MVKSGRSACSTPGDPASASSLSLRHQRLSANHKHLPHGFSIQLGTTHQLFVSPQQHLRVCICSRDWAVHSQFLCSSTPCVLQFTESVATKQTELKTPRSAQMHQIARIAQTRCIIIWPQTTRSRGMLPLGKE